MKNLLGDEEMRVSIIDPRKAAGSCGAYRNTGFSSVSVRLLLLGILLLCWGLLSAQSNQEEYNLLKSFSLPKVAVPVSDLQLVNEVYQKDGNPFTGIAFEKFASGRLSRVISIFRGVLQGPEYLWYMDGAPQMSANYSKGRLQGRFLGWYRNGGIIYDMAINNGAWGGDYITDDGNRSAEDTTSTDGEGDAGNTQPE
jgi:hypothetical protein